MKGLRIKNDGKMNFHYRMSSRINSESGNLCHELTLSIYNRVFYQIYSGELSIFFVDRDIDSSGADEWIVMLAHDSDEPGDSKLCNFDIVIKTWRTSVDEQGGFYDEKILQNTVTTQ